jgi:hypothetical protein
MSRARSISVVTIALLLAACGSNVPGPAARNGILLRAADLPDMRIHDQSPALEAFPFSDVLGHGIVFKDPPVKVIARLKSDGFVHGYAEQFIGAGTLAGAFVAQFTAGKTDDMLKYMNGNLFEECPGDPTCSKKTILAVPAIPGSYGQTLQPNRDATEGLPITTYKVLFAVGSLIFGMEIGGDEIYDPGTVTKSQALTAFKAFYDHVKGMTASKIFSSAPGTPLGSRPGADPGASLPPGVVPSGSPS